MMSRKQSKLSKVLTSVICLILGLFVGLVASVFVTLPDSYVIPDAAKKSQSSLAATGDIDVNQVITKDLSIHFLELGNKYTGDCTLIKVGDTEILIDAGSKASSVSVIESYVNKYCSDGILEYVVVTHAHEDHYAGFATNNYADSIFSKFTVKNIIEFAKTNKSSLKEDKNYNKMYSAYSANRQKAINDGASYFKANYFIQNSDENNISLGNGVTLQILNQKFYTDKAATENDYSVCLMINQNDKHYLFTGDLEKEGEKSLVALNSLPKVDVYKAGHHGSKTSSSTELLEVIQPKTICVCCCAGSSEYTSKNENQFPTQEFVNNVYGTAERLSYTTSVYVTSLCIDYSKGEFTSFNGNIVIFANNNTVIEISCSVSTKELRESDWFKANRTLPTATA